MKRIALPLLILALSGCKTELKTLVNVSQLNNNTPTVVTADLNIEVAGCNSFEDSRIESSSLKDAKKAISGIIPKAQYVQCYQKKMNSFAHFTVPVIVGELPDFDQLDSSAFYLFPKPQLNQALMVALPKEMKQRIQTYKKRSFMPTLNDFNIEIVLKNDTNDVFSFKPIATYINDIPVVTTYDKGIPLDKGQSVTIRLSDVSAANALLEGVLATPVLGTVNS